MYLRGYLHGSENGRVVTIARTVVKSNHVKLIKTLIEI
jgi:hypothetical protein